MEEKLWESIYYGRYKEKTKIYEFVRNLKEILDQNCPSAIALSDTAKLIALEAKRISKAME